MQSGIVPCKAGKTARRQVKIRRITNRIAKSQYARKKKKPE